MDDAERDPSRDGAADRARNSDPGRGTNRPGTTDGEPTESAALESRIVELEETLEALRAELHDSRRGPFGLPRPPAPGELLRFTERHAIPTAIAVLEAQVEALKLLQGGLRLADPERAVREESTKTRDRAERAGRAVIDRLDSTLADLQTEIEEGTLPPGGEARDVVEQARDLTGEIDAELRGGRSAGRRGGDGEAATEEHAEASGSDSGASTGGADAASDSEDVVQIDVEGELRSIKEELDDAGEPEGGEADGGGSVEDAAVGADGDEPSEDDGDGPTED